MIAPLPSRKTIGGFTLVEVVLAIGIVASVVLVMAALISQSVGQSRQVLDHYSIVRATDAATGYLNSTPFDTVYGWLASGAEEDLVVCTYRGVPPAATATSSPPAPVLSASGDPGSAYILTTVVSATDASTLASEASASDTRLFLMRLAVSPASPVTPLPASVTSYAGASLVVQSRVYLLPALSDVSKVLASGNAVYTFNSTIGR